jgi:hypothetical protein
MAQEASVQRIHRLGFEWPKYALVEQCCVVQDDRVDLAKTIEAMWSSRAFYRGQLTAAYKFKVQTGADYADFTDRRDDYARMERELGQAIAYLEQIVAALDR